MRGAGLLDAAPNHDSTRAGIQRFYGTDDTDRVIDGWRPYRICCSVLVHASERRARSGERARRLIIRVVVRQASS